MTPKFVTACCAFGGVIVCQTDGNHISISSFEFRPMLRPRSLAGVQGDNGFHVPRDEVLCSFHTVALQRCLLTSQ
jgi:hypothetical protein